MNKYILLLSLLACGTKPSSNLIDSNNQEDTTKEAEEGKTFDIQDIVYNPDLIPAPDCSNHIENPDHHFRVLPSYERKRICSLVGIDQRGRVFDIQDFRGDIVILQIGDMTCVECIHLGITDDIYHVIRHRYPDQSIQYVSTILRDKNLFWADADDVKWWYEENNINNHPVIAVEQKLIGYSETQWMPYRDERRFPMFYIIDKYGRLAWASMPYEKSQGRDFLTDHEWYMTVEQLLMEP